MSMNMCIAIHNIDSKFLYDIENIIKLFFEEPVFHYGGMGTGQPDSEKMEPDVSLYFDLQFPHGEAVCTVRVMDREGNSSQEQSKSDAGEVKKAVNVALLKGLSTFTGVEQPWGILTGVRPVKIYHNLLLQGLTDEQIAKHLEEKYLIKPAKIKVMERIVHNQLKVIPDLHHLDKEVSVYIGIPFCPTKCAYCTFPAYSIQGKQGSVDAFLQGLHIEIEEMGNWLKKHQLGITTIYFGGGTPTSITAEEMDALFTAIERFFPNGGRSRELTVEAGRPDTITPDKIEVMKKWKVDRISINPQSFTQRTLQAIGRHHTVEETLEKYDLARKMGMNNINMDLIIGLPGEGMQEFLHSLEMVERLRPESLTVHTLSFKSASTMTKNREKYQVASREEVAEIIRHTENWTLEQGYTPYYLYRQKNILGNQENVGYALPGKESLYNIIIMEEKQTILGLGCGAVSKVISPITKKITRYANPKEPKAYNDNYQAYIDGKIALLEKEYNYA